MKLIGLMPRGLSLQLNRFYDVFCRPPFRRFLPLRELTIETTTYCNLKCKGCYRTNHHYKSKNMQMSLVDFKHYVDQVPSAYTLILHGQGEPTLNPDLLEMIKYANDSKKFRYLNFTTNVLAKKPEIYNPLFANGLNFIIISVDSLDQKEADILRTGTSVDQLYDNIKYLFKRFPDKILFRMAISKLNVKTFMNTIQKLTDIGVKTVGFQPYFDLGDSTLCLSIAERDEFLSKIKLLREDNIQFNLSPMFGSTYKHCNNPYNSPVITVDGNLSPCCGISNSAIFTWGNLKESTFKKLFFSRKNDSLQQSIKKGKYPFFCKNCTSNHVEQVLWGEQKNAVE